MLNFLTFSDSAKYADVARNLITGFGYSANFSFWSAWVFDYLGQNIFSASGIPPVMPFSIAAFFKIFGVNDFAIMATSLFYFLLTLFFVFLLAKKIFKSTLTGILSVLAVGFNYDLINYATVGASEAPLIFEIVAASYFISLKKKWGTIAAFVLVVLMYFTRAQAPIYIAGLILFWLLTNFSIKKSLTVFVIVLVAGFLVDYFILPKLAGKYFLYSFTGRGLGAAVQVTAGGSASDSLRGGAAAASGVVLLIKKSFYNLYNFYKLLPQIINPYLFAVFLIGLFKWGKGQLENSFKISSVLMIVLTLSAAAASIPFFRYIHPIIPLVYIIAVGTLVETIDLGFRNYDLRKRQLFINLTSLFLILVFAVGQTLGIFLLDSRFEAKIHNVGKPPVYVVLSKILKDNTQPNQIVITNLDTWGTWYGERKTIWFPVEPKQIIDPATGEIPFGAIYLTSYLIDDENYYMGADWRLIFNNPSDPKKWTCEGCAKIAKEFKLKGVYKIEAREDYERVDSNAILLIKR